ncbi:MAG: sensor histidine kinase [Nocardioides sp.]|uniref:sensor histidine kinase n=1 Tax=Nocardioides sp. TaxID=35761 RepID=UPI003EFE373A
MTPALPQTTAAQLRGGLHALVVALAVVVMLRALLLDEAHPVAVSALVVAFVVVHLTRAAAAPGPNVRLAGLWLLVALWLAMSLLGADAAYVSVALSLLFLTELSLPAAVAGVVAVTTVDLVLGVVRGGGVEVYVAPLLGMVVSTLIGLGFRVLFEVTASQARLIEELRRTRDELAASEHAAGQATERQRLAREIHDTVAQGLSSIQMLLHAAEAEELPEAAAQRIALARTTAGAGLAEARRMVAELAPADLSDATLVAALERVCERSLVDARLVVDGAPAPLPMPLEAALVRIAQGALANVERHAGADARAVLTLHHGRDAVRLDVVDDGAGFDVAVLDDPEQHSFGLDTIRTRVADLGGECSIDSEPGHTALSVALPLSVPAQEAP